MGSYIDRLKGEVEPDERTEEPVITVSGFSGSGKSTFAKIIAEETGLEHRRAGQVFRKLAKERGMTIDEFSKKREDEVDLMLDRKFLKLAMEGGYVLDARLSGWVAGDYADVRVFLKIDPEVATRRIQKRENISYKEAYKRTQVRDKADKKKYRELYDLDFKDLSVFDFVINNSLLSLKQLKEMAELVSEVISRT